MVSSDKYLSVLVDNRLDWKENTGAIFKRPQVIFPQESSGLLRSVTPAYCMFYQSTLASILFYAIVCWGCGLRSGTVVQEQDQ